jgi:hypothetical protein
MEKIVPNRVLSKALSIISFISNNIASTAAVIISIIGLIISYYSLQVSENNLELAKENVVIEFETDNATFRLSNDGSKLIHVTWSGHITNLSTLPNSLVKINHYFSKSERAMIFNGNKTLSINGATPNQFLPLSLAPGVTVKFHTVVGYDVSEANFAAVEKYLHFCANNDLWNMFSFVIRDRRETVLGNPVNIFDPKENSCEIEGGWQINAKDTWKVYLIAQTARGKEFTGTVNWF